MKNKIYVCCDACACSLRGFCSIHTLDLHVRQRLFGFLKKSLLSAGDEANINETQTRGGDICEKENNCGNPVAPAGCAQPAYANSAQRHWSGTDVTGAVVTGEDCPIVVERELLTFDVQEFPEQYYPDTDSFLAYTGKVTAEYTFRNPADYTVTATLVFPFGTENTSMTKQRVGRSMFPTP